MSMHNMTIDLSYLEKGGAAFIDHFCMSATLEI